jgi:hypothetical protein
MQHIVKERKDMNLKENKEGNKKKIDVGAFFFFGFELVYMTLFPQKTFNFFLLKINFFMCFGSF